MDGVAEAAGIMTLGFTERGWSVDIATAPTLPQRKSLKFGNSTIHEFNISGNGHPNNPFRGEIDDYLDFAENGVWDIVIIHAYVWSFQLSRKRLARLPGKKIIVGHGYSALQWTRVARFPWGLRSLLWTTSNALNMCFWLPLIDRAVYLSEQADFKSFFDHLIANLTHHQGRRVIPNGVDLSVHAADASLFRNKLGIKPEQILFLCVANYSPRKDQGYAARAFRTAAIPNSVLVFIGSEFNESSLQFQKDDSRYNPNERSEAIIWLEKQNREATLNAFGACDVFVLSANAEAQPIALLEAMREQKSWISRDVGCIREMPGGICVNTETGMAAAMRQLAVDANLRKSLGDEGRAAVVTVYNRKHYVEAYCQLVQELCGNLQAPESSRSSI